MLRKASLILLGFTVLFYLFHFLFFWLFESTDSYFYWEFANFLKTGKYFVEAYGYTRPSTMEPPLYSVFLFVVQFFPRADILIHSIQLGAILASGYFLYRIFERYTKKAYALFLATVFLLTPAHIIYTGNLVAEPIAVFLISLYLFLLSKIFSPPSRSHGFSFGKLRISLPPGRWSYYGVLLHSRGVFSLLILSSVMVLQRYNLILFFGFALFGAILILRKRFYPSVVMGVGLSLILLLSWVGINYSLNGSIGLSNAEGKHLYNRIFHFDRILPPDSDPSFIEYKKIVQPTIAWRGIDYFLPWWYYERDLIYHLGSETKANELFMKVSLAALKTNPMKYILDTPGYFLFAHASNPTFHDDLYRYNGAMEKGCRTLGTIQFCRPVFQIDGIDTVWDRLVYVIDWYYLNISPLINFLILFPAIVFSLVKRDKFMKIVSILYVGSILLFVLVEAPLPRYTYIFTPLKSVLIGYFMILILQFIANRLKSKIPISNVKSNPKSQ